ncbi:2-hydroxyacid dehydrogenase [Klebsiella pneumoniae]
MRTTYQQTLLINFVSREDIDEWRNLFLPNFPDLRIASWDDPSVEPESVHYVLVWEPERGKLAQFPNLRVILSEAAGVDHILNDSTVPANIPITRMVTPETESRMADYVTMACYLLVRQIPLVMQAQKRQSWKNKLTGRLVNETSVGIMGMGRLGTAVAKRLLANGFTVRGWSRTEKNAHGVQCYAENDQLAAFLRESHILVNLLPDTIATRGIINAELLEQLPPNAGLINVGRGHQLDHDALLVGLNNGHLSGAVLDVFPVEPLPPEDPLWTHPRIIITSHVASLISNTAKAKQAIEIIQADRSGLPLPLVLNREYGY